MDMTYTMFFLINVLTLGLSNKQPYQLPNLLIVELK